MIGIVEMVEMIGIKSQKSQQNDPKNSNKMIPKIPTIPKILLIIFLIIFILQMLAIILLMVIPLVAQAEIPALNPGCWLKDSCKDAGGYWEEDPACGGKGSDWGRCYPGTEPITLGVKIPGVGKEEMIGEVKDIAEYIARIYGYTVGVGAILAVVMIVWGGIVYLTAGGIPERISQAKEYISNAIVGLVLLYTSYLLLQTINPSLVKLRMPRVYMIRTIYMGALYCNELKPTEGLQFALAAKSPDEVPTSLAEIKASDYNIKLEKTMCGQVYYEKSRAEQTCVGVNCEDWKTKVGAEEKTCGEGEGKVGCVCKFSEEDKKYFCSAGSVTVDVTFETTGDKPYINSLTLEGRCSEAAFIEILQTGEKPIVTRSTEVTFPFTRTLHDEKSGKQFFILPYSPEYIEGEISPCPAGKFEGFFLVAVINDNNGVDDSYYIDKDGMGHDKRPPKELFFPREDVTKLKLNPFRLKLNRNTFPTR